MISDSVDIEDWKQPYENRDFEEPHRSGNMRKPQEVIGYATAFYVIAFFGKENLGKNRENQVSDWRKIDGW
jgi:hypothetical protein